MRHFEHLPVEVRANLFHREPGEFDVDSPTRTLAVALGATLYCPATRPQLAEDIVKQAGRGVVSMVLCLEDSIDDAEVAGAEENLVRQFAELSGRAPGTSLPLLFIRVRTPGQIVDLVSRLGAGVRLLSGFVLPKFTEERGGAFLEALLSAETAQVTEVLGGRRLFAMPVLESPELMHRETRTDSLSGISRIVDKYRERVLALRLGVTDLCSAYGLRRAPDMTAYDVQLVASVIADVVNMLGRADGTGFTITGPVWEYFKPHERMFKPQLRISPFSSGRAESLRTALIEHHMDGLLREIELDRANGLQGKTCIHPSHVAPVHALSVVSHEEFSDAVDILEPQRCGGGVLRSSYTNKMNEVKPHRAWAERTLRRAEVFGVAREDVSFVELLAASLRT
ncbi:HpcH/HpaI aldolase/citrate lyase family protein [Streptomyces rugosispiralis]|uniref:HpcH/HpaI aldolase/citrate lyase family protein n=1 Tax=Streptomyces rugosispiralis TaxID=2967341 RepID=A0ABT1VA04_9ACTN|nr:HpcH/HpaI aldolase/citrate lyase family protein [Streptomyces rugosispiralis]MCQ8194230.1 HpcH/HpaI aldolase/citrate lyase family protein [Streptomyces rugosispiralis]